MSTVTEPVVPPVVDEPVTGMSLRALAWRRLRRDRGAMFAMYLLIFIFLTAIFAANHKLVFPAAALVAWCTLAYLCVDFGFFHKLFNLRPEDNAVYRAAGEAWDDAGNSPDAKA